VAPVGLSGGVRVEAEKRTHGRSRRHSATLRSRCRFCLARNGDWSQESVSLVPACPAGNLLAQEFDDSQIARILSRQRRRSGLGRAFTRESVGSLRGKNKIPAAPKKRARDDREGRLASSASPLAPSSGGFAMVCWATRARSPRSQIMPRPSSGLLPQVFGLSISFLAAPWSRLWWLRLERSFVLLQGVRGLREHAFFVWCRRGPTLGETSGDSFDEGVAHDTQDRGPKMDVGPIESTFDGNHGLDCVAPRDAVRDQAESLVSDPGLEPTAEFLLGR